MPGRSYTPRMDLQLLILGAGPYSLAIASIAEHLGISFAISGEPADLWRQRVPRGLILRSGPDWHIDPLEVHTLERFWSLHRRERDPDAPLTREEFLSYLQWYIAEKGIEALPARVERLAPVDGGYVAALDDGQEVTARWVVIAPGFSPFRYSPSEVTKLLPPGRFSHTAETIEPGAYRDRRCLVVGGRQSAFEWAALLAEHGAAAVHLVYRHPTPRFTASDWSWVGQCIDQTIADPMWFRKLPTAERDQLVHRFWIEGQAKLEPWLQSRIRRPEIFLHPESRIADCRLRPDASLQAHLSDGSYIVVDHVILATGYSMDLERVDCLANSPLLPRIEVDQDYPRLDAHFQCSQPGLFFAGFPTTRAFGPFFGFLVGASVTARLLGDFWQGSSSS